MVAGTSSEGDGTTRPFQGYFYGGVLSLGLCGGVLCAFSASSTIFGHFESHISKFSSKFCNVNRSPTAGRYILTIIILNLHLYILKRALLQVIKNIKSYTCRTTVFAYIRFVIIWLSCNILQHM